MDVIPVQDDKVVHIDMMSLLHHIVPRSIHWFTRYSKFNRPNLTVLGFFQILHALGLLHEHQRPDRDQYIDVDMEVAKANNFYDALKKARFQVN